MRILLIEPSYKNKYPPLGLMKIATFHKERGDEVHFVKGLNKDLKIQTWDRIYIATLFSFYWSKTIETIKYYEYSVNDPQNLFIGGPMATVMASEIEKDTGYKVVDGLLNKKGKIKLPHDEKIDSLIPDYSILNELEYKYHANNAYFAYMTRGCIRRCQFCAVPTIEPYYVEYIPLKEHIEIVNEKYGEKKDLLLLDNNVLASSRFNKIIDEIQSVGFYNGAKLKNSFRHVDFNQGLDLRLLTEAKMKRLAEIPIKPIRIAFDHISLKKQYINKIELAAKYGLIYLSNYILYNYINDTPEDLYSRLKINVELNERLGTHIFSFPMKYVPVDSKDRKFVGNNWTPKHLRSIQCILNVTHGLVGPKIKFFEAAFGKNLIDFKKLILMPDNYIIYRKKHKNNGATEWDNLFSSLSHGQKNDFLKIIQKNQFNDRSKYPEVNSLLTHYQKGKYKNPVQSEMMI